MTASPWAAGGGASELTRVFPGAVPVSGPVHTSKLTDADYARLDDASTRRGVKGHLPRPPRPLSESEQLDAYCQWLHQEHHLNLIGVVTFSDETATKRGIYSIERALDDTWRGLTVGMRYPWKFVLAGEHHRTGRTVPHVHLALEAPEHARERVCGELFSYFLRNSGRSRFEPMRDVTAATLYGLKDTVKTTREDTAALRLRLWHPARCGTR